MWVKWVGGILLLTAAGAFCLLQVRRLKRTERCAWAWVELLRTVHTHISCFATPLPEILRVIPPQLRAELTDDPTVCEEGDLRAWCRAAATELPCEIGDCLLRLSDEVGRLWRQEQLERLAFEIGVIEEQAKRLSQALPLSIRLRSTLSLCGTVAIMILIW